MQPTDAGDPKVAFNDLVLGQALSSASRLEETRAVLREGLDSARSSSLPQRFIPDLEFALAQVLAPRRKPYYTVRYG